MGQRIYNVFFHTHTISGIIISCLLYIIFFTGSISFLRDEINAWERNEPIPESYFGDADYDGVLRSLDKKYGLYARDISFTHRYFEKRVATSLMPTKDTIKNPKGDKRQFFYLDLDTYESKDYIASYSMGEFFYRLHFFAQLNFYGRSGYLLAGLVAFFFLFAIVTGVIVHWKKIIPSFYLFRPKAKWKTIWTDAHVGLGMIGLPYQFLYAVTGVFLIGGIFILPPVEKVLLGDRVNTKNKVIQKDSPDDFKIFGELLDDTSYSVSTYVSQAKSAFKDIHVTSLDVYNYGDKNMHVKVGVSPSYNAKLIGAGHLLFRAKDGAVVASKDPYVNNSYIGSASNIMDRLHFGDFGGYGIKLVFFILGIITCFVILSGVLIWLVARDKKHVSPSKRIFNQWLGYVYISVCLSLYPITALTFIVVKLYADSAGSLRKVFIYKTFFLGWLLLTLLFTFMKNNALTNRLCLLLGAILGFLVPISNGVKTGNWLWVSYTQGNSQILVVDLFWLILSLVSFIIWYKLYAKQKVV